MDDEATDHPLNNEEARRFYAALLPHFPSEGGMTTWLRTCNKAFDAEAPLTLVGRGEFAPLWRMIYRLESGTAT